MAPTVALRVAGLLALAVSVRGAPAVTTTVYVPPSSPTTTPEPYAISHHNVTSHGPYTGPPATTTGPLSTSVIVPSIARGPLRPTSWPTRQTASCTPRSPCPTRRPRISIE